ncbi:hypothetical protein B0H10DRAFT_2349870, partial [Mycena sp. CBHHK59/15]
SADLAVLLNVNPERTRSDLLPVTESPDPWTPMDQYYDLKAAIAQLDNLSVKRQTAIENRRDAADKALASVNVESFEVTETGGVRKEWRLCSNTESTESDFELTVRLQGILANVNLVPNSRETQNLAFDKRLYLSQRVTVGGFGSTKFAESLNKRDDVFNLFDRHFPQRTLMPARYEPGTLSASTRYFTLKMDALTEDDTPFSRSIDPMGELERMKGKDLIHLDDNKVKLLKKQMKDSSRKSRYEEASPSNFETGDIVELQIYFVATQRKDGKVMLTTRLHGMTLLDKTYTKAGLTTERAMYKITYHGTCPRTLR